MSGVDGSSGAPSLPDTDDSPYGGGALLKAPEIWRSVEDMSNVLDQGEVDALLAAVDSGEFSPDSGLGSQETTIFSRRRKHSESIEVREYDFKRPERVSKDQMRALQTLHEAFARNFGAALSGFLRMIVEVKVASCEQITYGEFVSALPNPTSFHLDEQDLPPSSGLRPLAGHERQRQGSCA